MENLQEQELSLQLCIIVVMQKEERPDSRNRQAAGNDRPQNEDQIWQRLTRDSDCSDGAEHDEERAARKVHLLLSEIPTPAWQDIVMDRTAWNKMPRSISTPTKSRGLTAGKRPALAAPGAPGAHTSDSD
jgi:hypothetical protein